GVGGVGAGGDGRDDDGAVVDLGLGAVGQGDLDRVVRTAAHRVGGVAAGRAVVVGDRRGVGGREGLGGGLVDLGHDAVGVHVVVDVLAPGRLGVGQRDAVLRALGSGDGRHHVGEVELQVLGVLGLHRRVVPQALGL